MQPSLIIGIIIFFGFLMGELASKMNLPKISGYIVAGIILNPDLFGFVPADFSENTEVITNIALSFITFSVGGTLLISKIRKLGKNIITITLLESEIAFLLVLIGLVFVLPFFLNINNADLLTVYLPIALLLGSMASPTDPSATLAVMHQYKAKGSVSSTIMGVAAFDDAVGIINYSIAIAISKTLITHADFSMVSSILQPIIIIMLSIALGAIMGFILIGLLKITNRETDGVLIVEILGLLLICFGVGSMLNLDELLSTMSMGAIVVNFSAKQEKVFKLLERYIEEIILVLFFVLAGMHLKFSVVSSSVLIVLVFIILRTAGKYIGLYIGASISKAPNKVKRYTFGGILPQGGIVIGLALMIQQYPDLADLSDTIIGVIIGATIVHELIGPISAKIALEKAHELYKADD